MKSQVLIKRYTQGLVNSIEKEEEFSALYSELLGFSNLVSRQKKLKDILFTPFLPTPKKMQIIEEIMAKESFKKKTSRFILLLVENNRLELLPLILNLLPVIWNEKKGISTFEIYSVIPLTDNQKKRLEEKLELFEKKPVSLKYKIDNTLIGGLSIKKGNIIYDASIKGSILKLKEKISAE